MLDMERSGLIFTRIEKVKKIKFPNFIKKFLFDSGFDSAAALKTIEKSTIDNLEEFVKNRLDLLKNSDYVNETEDLKKNPFKFLPGHRALILCLPKDIDHYLSEKEKEKEKAKIIRTIEVLKSLLVKKLSDFATQNSLQSHAQSVSAITQSNNKVKSFVTCPLCSAKICCTFNSSWKLSNYQKHIKSCVKKQPNRPIQRVEPASVLREVQNALS